VLAFPYNFSKWLGIGLLNDKFRSGRIGTALYTPTCASVLSGHIGSPLGLFMLAVTTIICYAPQAICVRTPCFTLPGEISLYQADHVSLEEPACSTRAGSATSALLLTKFVSLVRGVSRWWLMSFPHVVPLALSCKVVPVLVA
jgi:hypothetical protein